ncbi:MAG TPA: tetratricopeptide repeat protein [Bryobacteraceae bacterium]
MKRLVLCLSIGMLLAYQAGAQHIKAAEDAYEAGQIARHQELSAKAARLFQKAIRIEPTFMEARQGLIDVYLKAGQDERAASAITQFLEIEPTASQDRILLGQLLLKQGEIERALAQFSLALTTDPDNADALFGFAVAAKRMGMKDRAAKAIARGRKLHPRDKRFRSAEK